ncbi:MAG: Maf family protein [Myxococcaceae bacterium]
MPRDALPLILASTSPARRALMDALGLPYRAVPPEVDEDVPRGTPPRRMVALLAEKKARAVHARFPGSLVIGADQLAVIGKRALGKPRDRAEARRQLRLLRTHPHEITTGLCVVGDHFFARAVDVARIRFHRISDEELERYLDLEEWRGCAGGYRVEAAGQALFESLTGDRTGVQGLPLIRLTAMLRRAGVEFFPA